MLDLGFGITLGGGGGGGGGGGVQEFLGFGRRTQWKACISRVQGPKP